MSSIKTHYEKNNHKITSKKSISDLSVEMSSKNSSHQNNQQFKKRSNKQNKLQFKSDNTEEYN